MRWPSRLIARIFGWPPRTSPQAIQCLHPSFTPCNRYGYAVCTVCKTKLPC